MLGSTGGTGPDDPSAGPQANGLPPQIGLDLRAKVAVQDPTSGAWTMASTFVRVPVVGVYDGNVLKCGLRLVKLTAGVTSTADLDGNCQPIDLDADLQVRFSVGDAEWDAEHGLFKPGYFYAGFSGSPGQVKTLSGQAAEQAMQQADTVVVPIAELVAVKYGLDGDAPVNAAPLTAKCKALSARYLKDASTPPRLLPAVGFLDFTFDGTLTEVEIDQQACLTRFRMDSWFRPAGSYLASEFERLRRKQESHPHEARTQGARQAIGAAGSSAPVQPMDHYAVTGGGGLPPGGLKYQVIMRIDDAGTAGWDYPRMH